MGRNWKEYSEVPAVTADGKAGQEVGARARNNRKLKRRCLPHLWRIRGKPVPALKVIRQLQRSRSVVLRLQRQQLCRLFELQCSQNLPRRQSSTPAPLTSESSWRLLPGGRLYRWDLVHLSATCARVRPRSTLPSTMALPRTQHIGGGQLTHLQAQLAIWVSSVGITVIDETCRMFMQYISRTTAPSQIPSRRNSGQTMVAAIAAQTALPASGRGSNASSGRNSIGKLSSTVSIDSPR